VNNLILQLTLILRKTDDYKMQKHLKIVIDYLQELELKTKEPSKYLEK